VRLRPSTARLLLLLAALAIGLGLRPPAAAQPTRGSGADLAFAVHRFGLRDGLPQISVTDLVQGPDRRLWITTFGGLAVYDGAEIAAIDMAVEPALPANRFVSAAVDPSGVLWFGTENAGLVKRLADGRFIAVPLPAPLTDRVVWDLTADPRGGVWAAAEAGVAYISHAGVIETHLVAPADGFAVSVAPSSRGVLVGTTTTLLRLDGQQLRPARVGEEDPGPTWTVGEDRRGGVWGGGMGQIWRWTDAGLERWTNRAWNVRFAEDPEGGTWWADGDALLHIGVDGALDRAEAVGLSSDNRAMMVDAEGSLWVGSGNRGLFHLEPRRMALWAAPSAGDSPGVLPVVEARDGTIWTGGACGPLVRWGPDGPLALALPRGAAPVNLHPCFVELLPTPDGGLWALSQEEIWWVDASAPAPTARLALALPPSDARIRSAALSPDGSLVVSRSGLEPEVAALDGQGGVRLRPIGRPELPRPRAGLSFTWGPDGDLWAAAEGELLRLPAEGGAPQRWGLTDGLPRGLPRALRVVGPDEVWIGTYGGGLALLREGRLRRVSTRQGLIENIVSQVIIDQTGGMWLNGNRGISWVPTARVNAFRTGESDELSAILYVEGEGNGGSMSAGGLSRGGRVLLPTVDGLRVLRPEAPAPTAGAAPVVFEAVVADDHPVPIVGGRAALPAGADAVQVQFRALSFRASDRLRFRHRLAGFDQRWVEVGASRTARYTNLPPGRYALHLQVQGSAGVWVDTGTRLELEVQPAWHQRGGVRAALAAALLGAGGLLWWSRTQALRRRNAQLLAQLDAQRLAEAETRAREQRYRAVFEQAHNGFLLHRADGALLDLNPPAAALFGEPAAALRAAAPLRFIEPAGQEAYRGMLGAAAAGGEAEVEVWASRRGPDGLPQRFLLRAEARPHAVGQDPACLVAVADRSAALAQEAERAQLQRSIEQAQRLDAVGRLAGGVAHDFNNELTAILLQVDQLRGAVSGPVAHRSLLELEASAQRAAEITRGLLSFARGAGPRAAGGGSGRGLRRDAVPARALRRGPRRRAAPGRGRRRGLGAGRPDPAQPDGPQPRHQRL
jgi:PAS domain S-box-containing protein